MMETDNETPSAGPWRTDLPPGGQVYFLAVFEGHDCVELTKRYGKGSQDRSSGAMYKSNYGFRGEHPAFWAQINMPVNK